ncbi:MAG: hypothetical protein MJE77_16580 [Proteobacteria bacterium]|nr:hypothetical protein [Pseudomonadota bacterium]
MSKQTTSQTQQETRDSNAWDQAFPFQQSFDLWIRLARSQFDRMQALADELAEFEGEAYGHARRTAREVTAQVASQLAKMIDEIWTDENLSCAATLSAEWRKLVLDATRKTREFYNFT